MPKVSEKEIRCSFCGKPQASVKKLIAGPSGVFICDECIKICQNIIDEEEFEEEKYTINDEKNYQLQRKSRIY